MQLTVPPCSLVLRIEGYETLSLLGVRGWTLPNILSAMTRSLPLHDAVVSGDPDRYPENRAEGYETPSLPAHHPLENQPPEALQEQ